MFDTAVTRVCAITTKPSRKTCSKKIGLIFRRGIGDFIARSKASISFGRGHSCVTRHALPWIRTRQGRLSIEQSLERKLSILTFWPITSRVLFVPSLWDSTPSKTSRISNHGDRAQASGPLLHPRMRRATAIMYGRRLVRPQLSALAWRTKNAGKSTMHAACRTSKDSLQSYG